MRFLSFSVAKGNLKLAKKGKRRLAFAIQCLVEVIMKYIVTRRSAIRLDMGRTIDLRDGKFD